MFFLAAWKIICSFFNSIFKFFADHPMVLVCLMVLVFGLVFGFKLGVSHVEAKYAPIMKKVAGDAKEREEVITRIEADSAKAAEEAKAEIAARNNVITDISNSYERKLEEAQSKQAVRTVIVPGAKETVYVNQEGQVSCRRLPDAFVPTINGMIDAANGSAKQEE
jgi:hypothetical protein